MEREGIGCPGEWRRDDALRVLLESDDERDAWRFARLLERNGCTTAVCAGPAGCIDGCPLLTEGSCSVADGADVIVYTLGLSSTKNRSVLWGHRPYRSARPVIVTTDAETAAEHENVLDGLVVFRGPVRGSELVQSVARAQAKRHGRRTPTPVGAR